MLSLWESVRDLTRKDHAGYTSKEEFNRLVANAQSDLFEYYIGVCQIDARAKMALQWLIVEATLTKALPQYYNLPSTFRYPLNVGAVVIESADCTPSIDNYPSDEWSSDEDLLTLRSPIRKPSIEKRRFAHEFIGGQIKMWQKTSLGEFTLSITKNRLLQL